MTDFFDVQPTTKTFEYLFAGMPVIATATSEHKKVINDKNGVLVQDNPEGFCNGLKHLYQTRMTYDSSIIKELCSEHAWERIVRENFIPYLNTVV